ncbi:Cytochrome P450 [Macleaya cordata]|uniref:Cytochrome P450 n=1 Tax=Macleaya cordata TaxID=56857 RepID=A0A200Q8C9_MACCD|nr:Cytochrome P450 [Macleaya cordata]
MGVLVRTRRKLPYPPGPKGLPILGNMFMMDQLTHRGLAQLSKQHGGLFHLKIGFLHMVTVSTPDMARQVLQQQDNIFSNRPANIAIKYLTYDRADMAFAHYGPFWRQMRKICVMKLFSRKRAESWDSVRDEVESMVRFIESKTGSPVNIGELVFNLMKNIIFRAAFGTISHEGQEEFVSIMQEFSKLFGAFNIADFFPWLGWVDPQGFYKRLGKARMSLDRFIDHIIDDHEQKKKNKIENDVVDGDVVETDMVDELIAAREEEKSINLTRDNIKAIIMVRT